MYRLIALPLAGPMAALGIIAFLASWNAYFAPSIFLNSIDKATMPLALVADARPLPHGQRRDDHGCHGIAILPP